MIPQPLLLVTSFSEDLLIAAAFLGSQVQPHSASLTPT